MAWGITQKKTSTDDYEKMLQRLDAVADKLRERQKSRATALEVLNQLHSQNRIGLDLWKERQAKVEQALVGYAGGPIGEKTLSELRDVALKMVPMFQSKTAQIEHRIASLQGGEVEIAGPLEELKQSKLRLVSSKMLARERENLTKAVVDLAGSEDGAMAGAADLGWRAELKRAHESVRFAEMLMESKGE